MGYKIKNWEEFQHYTDRNPPWIKLHKALLDNRAIAMLSDCNYRILTGLWLLASEDKELEGRLPSVADIAYRLRKTEEEIINAIQGLSEFIMDDSPMLALRYPSRAQVQTETETETETETDARGFSEFWKIFPSQRKGNREKAEAAYRQALKRSSAEEILRGLKSYLDSDEVKRGFAKGATAWLNDDRWTCRYTGGEVRKPAGEVRAGAVQA